MTLKIYFGPYETHGVIKHKTQKLYGLLSNSFIWKVHFLNETFLDRLGELGYEVELIPTNRLNNLTIHLMDKQIYRCDIRYLMFNIEFEDDPVVQNIVKSVEETQALFNAEQNVAKFDTLQVRHTKDTRDFLAEDVDLIFEIPYSYLEFKSKSHSMK